jgi:hypothetical protein
MWAAGSIHCASTLSQLFVYSERSNALNVFRVVRSPMCYAPAQRLTPCAEPRRLAASAAL